MWNLTVLGPLVGGLGLFLLGLWLATDGVKLAGGGVLKTNLRTWARSRWRAFETGFAIALLVPSSSQLTCASIGFVNCGLVSPSNALWLVVGTSFGAVITAWLMVAAGLSPNLYALALVILAVGVFLRMSGPRTRRGGWGQALAGVGALFLGFSILTSSFAAIDPAHGIAAFGMSAGTRLAACIVAGTAVAALLRSASATVVLTLVAASTGVIDFSSGAALLIGANLGASSAAALSLLHGTPDAKRVALGHVTFHVMTSVVGFLILGFTSPGMGEAPRVFADPAFALAIFHTAFSVCGALLLWPLAPRLNLFLEHRFCSEAQDVGRPLSLDANVLAVPDLGLEGLLREVRTIDQVTKKLARTALRDERMTEFRTRQDAEVVSRLVQAVTDSLVRLNREEMPGEIARILVRIPNALSAFADLCETCVQLRMLRGEQGEVSEPHLKARMKQLQLAVLHLVEGSDPFDPDFSLTECGGELAAIGQHVREVTQRILSANARGEITPAVLERQLERLNALRAVGRHSVAAAASLEPAGRSPFGHAEAEVEEVDVVDSTALQAA